MPDQIYNFGLIGAAGYIAPRHMKAIKETGNKLIAALDPNDSVGIIDSYFPEADFFVESERFDRHLDKLRREGVNKIDYVAICSPNYLHDAHIRMSVRNQAHAICEKPIVLNPWNVEALCDLENETGKNIYTILQLRLHPSIIELKEKVSQMIQSSDHKFDVELKYITSRGRWYFMSWKGDITKSGGVATNIGVHFFDMLSWVFGNLQESKVFESKPDKSSGFLELQHARVQWTLSLDMNDVPQHMLQKGQRTFRSIKVNGEEVEFSEGFTDLHTKSYEATLAGNGFRLSDARQSIELVHSIRNFKF